MQRTQRGLVPCCPAALDSPPLKAHRHRALGPSGGAGAGSRGLGRVDDDGGTPGLPRGISRVQGPIVGVAAGLVRSSTRTYRWHSVWEPTAVARARAADKAKDERPVTARVVEFEG